MTKHEERDDDDETLEAIESEAKAAAAIRRVTALSDEEALRELADGPNVVRAEARFRRRTLLGLPAAAAVAAVAAAALAASVAVVASRDKPAPPGPVAPSPLEPAPTEPAPTELAQKPTPDNEDLVGTPPPSPTQARDAGAADAR